MVLLFIFVNGSLRNAAFSQGSELGPGTYNFKSFTQETVEKVTSLRGPYDLFSGDRNKPINDGYLAAPVSVVMVTLMKFKPA